MPIEPECTPPTRLVLFGYFYVHVQAALKAKLSALITAVQGEREIQRENFSTVSRPF